jgi:hypothetical protein
MEIRQFLLENELWQDVTIFYNGKAISTSDGKGNHSYNDPNTFYVLEDKNPADYLKYIAKPHILSMIFEGGFFGCLNFYNEQGADFDNKIMAGFSEILDRYGLHYELGEPWNLSCYRNQDSTVHTAKAKAKEPIRFWGDRTNPEYAVIPEPLLNIQQIWRDKANAYGDVGSCVIGAGFHFSYKGNEYIMPPISCWQGSVSWEHFVPEIQSMLSETGAENIRFEYGMMD